MADRRTAAQPRTAARRQAERPPARDDPLISVPRPEARRARTGPRLHVRLFGTHEFFRLWLAQVVAALGDWLGFLGITILAASVGASAGRRAAAPPSVW